MSHNKLSYQTVSNLFEENNCILLSTEYTKSIDKNLEFICKCGNKDVTSHNRFKHHPYCKICARKEIGNKLRKPLNDVKEIFKNEGCELLSEYKNAHTKVDFICSCGNKSSITLANFCRGKRCKKCASKKISDAVKGEKNGMYGKTGKLNPNYNPNRVIPEILRVNNVSLKEYIASKKIWRESIFKRDHFTCKACGKSKGVKYNAHHLYSKNKYPKLVFDLDNGVTLCVPCHKKFHSTYGWGNNTKEQFYEFLSGK